MKFILNLIKFFNKLFNYMYIYLLFKLNKVIFKSFNLRNAKGVPFLRNEGTFIIKQRVIINSKYSANPIGGQTFCTFVVRKGGKLILDEGVGISNSTIVCWKSIYIGKNVYIGGDCKVYDTDFHSQKLEKRISNEDDDISIKPVRIEAGAFIGTGSIILKGVTIGENSIVAAGSVVSKNIPPNQVWGGNPVRFIKNI